MNKLWRIQRTLYLQCKTEILKSTSFNITFEVKQGNFVANSQ